MICELCGVKMRPADSEQLAAGGITALAARHDAGAVKLLGQMR
jgi:hypothetical protein